MNRRRKPQYRYAEERPRESFDAATLERPQLGTRVSRRELGRRRAAPEAYPSGAEPDPGHGWQQYFEGSGRDALLRGSPGRPRPEEARGRYAYGRGDQRDDPYSRGRTNPYTEGYGELYGRRGADYAHRRRPLYGEAAEGGPATPGEPGEYPSSRGRVGGRWAGPERPPAEIDFTFEPPGPYARTLPRGYRRADERILDDVVDRLSRHGWVDSRGLTIEVVDGEVTLAGSVRDREMKHLAEDLAADVIGVRDVENRLRVRSGGSEPAAESEETAESGD